LPWSNPSRACWSPSIAAPGTIAPDGAGPYGPYAQALAEMMREGGLPLVQLFERVRLRVNE